MEERKVKMTINIAGEIIPLTVAFDQQDLVRETEKSVGELYVKWRSKFSGKSAQYLLAMIAYQFASHYIAIGKNHEEARLKLEHIAAAIDDALTQKS